MVAGLTLIASPATAQSYDMRTPAPRSTDAAAIRSDAVDREVEERFRRGLAAEARNDWNSARTEFERIISIDSREPHHSTALYDLAIAQYHLNELDDAANSLREALGADPNFLAAIANLIAIDVARRDDDAARKLADRFVTLAPDSARALYMRGIVALRQHDYTTAANDFGMLLKNNPAYAVAHYNLGIAQASVGQYVNAEREFDAALASAPSFARARFALATVYLKEGARDRARVALDDVIAHPGDDPTLKNLAQALRATL